MLKQHIWRAVGRVDSVSSVYENLSHHWTILVFRVNTISKIEYISKGLTSEKPTSHTRGSLEVFGGAI
jgi:hypothetical protein